MLRGVFILFSRNCEEFKRINLTRISPSLTPMKYKGCRISGQYLVYVLYARLGDQYIVKKLVCRKEHGITMWEFDSCDSTSTRNNGYFTARLTSRSWHESLTPFSSGVRCTEEDPNVRKLVRTSFGISIFQWVWDGGVLAEAGRNRAGLGGNRADLHHRIS